MFAVIFQIDRTPISWAAENGHVIIVTYLNDNGEDVNQPQHNTLVYSLIRAVFDINITASCLCFTIVNIVVYRF